MAERVRARVVVADQHAVLAESLRVVLEVRDYEARVVTLPERPWGRDETVGRVVGLRPDVLLLGTDLAPTSSGLRLIEPVSREGAAVVVLTETADEARWGECLVRGARAVLSKSSSLADVISVVRRAVRREPVLGRAERDRLVGLYRQHSSRVVDLRSRLDRLSPQEVAVLQLLMSGRTVGEIARQRGVAVGTVRSQVKSIHAKLEVSSQLAAVAAARVAGWAPARHVVLGDASA